MSVQASCLRHLSAQRELKKSVIIITLIIIIIIILLMHRTFEKIFTKCFTEHNKIDPNQKEIISTRTGISSKYLLVY